MYDVVIDEHGSCPFAGTTEDTIAWLKSHRWARRDPYVRVHCGDPTEELAVPEYLERFDNDASI